MLKRLLIASCIFVVFYILATQTALEDYFFDYHSNANQNYENQYQVVEEDEVAEIIELNKKEVYVNSAKPINLSLPSIKIEAAIQEVGITNKGAMETIDDPNPIAWYKFGALPGEEGNALLAGHREWYGEIGSLFKLDKMKMGDELIITYEDGHTQKFELVSNTLYKLDEVPKEVMSVNGESRVTLITCAGKFSKRMGTYDSRLIAIFKKVTGE